MSDEHILHGLGIEYRYISGGGGSDTLSRERDVTARIAELEGELATVNSLLDMKREREQHWSDEAWRYKNMNEQLRAELAELKATNEPTT